MLRPACLLSVLPVLLAGPAAYSRTREHGSAHSSHQAAPSGASPASIRALQKAKDAHQALLAQQSTQRQALQTRLAAQSAAQAKAAQDASRAAALSAASVAAVAQLQQTEQAASDLADRVAALRTEQSALTAQIAADAAMLQPMLPLIERMSLYPADTLLAAPVPPARAISGLLVMRGLSKELEQRAQDMRARQQQLSDVQASLAVQTARLDTLTQQQTAQRNTVAQSARLARDAQARSGKAAVNARRAVEEATRQATNIQDAIGRIESLEQAAEAQLEREAAAAEKAHHDAEAKAARARMEAMSNAAGPGLSGPAATQPGSRGAPVAGSVIASFGSATESGPSSGITYAPPSQANVRAPCTGRVDFAGAFRSYGQMLILDCGQHYRFVLAGLGNLAVGSGQSLTKGAALGAMPAWSGAGSRPTLFVQLRHGRDAVNPAPFL